MKKFNLKHLVLLAALFVASSVGVMAEDDSLPIENGMYTVTITTNSTAIPEPMTKVVDICITDDKFYPKDYMPKTAHCELENFQKKGKEAEFDILCQGGDGPEGKGGLPELTGKGKCNSIEGFYCSFNLAGELMGKELKIDTIREGERMGECPKL